MKAQRWLIVLFVAFVLANWVIAQPNPVIYRFQVATPKKVDLKNISLGNVLGAALSNLQGWVRDDSKWPSDKRILLLVHGYPKFDEGQNRNGLIALAEHFSQARKNANTMLQPYDVIYAVEYPCGYHILETAGVIDDIINDRCSLWPEGQKFDVFAHSMGGLVMRAAIQSNLRGKQPIANRVAHVVFMGTPNNGFPQIDLVKDYMEKFPEIYDMNSTGFTMIASINSNYASDHKVDCAYYSIVGTCSYKPKQFLANKDNKLADLLKMIRDDTANVSDGLVSTESAELDLSHYGRSFKKATVDVNHDWVKSCPETMAIIDQWMIEDGWWKKREEVKPQTNPTAIVKNVKYTGGWPILLGKTFEEVADIEGRIPDGTGVTGNFPDKQNHRWVSWFYDKTPTIYYKTSLIFLTENEGVKLSPPYRVYSGTYNFDFAGHFGKSNEIASVAQVVPTEILYLKPNIIGYDYTNIQDNYKNIVSVWFVNGQTFILISEDTNHEVYAKTRKLGADGLLVEKTVITDYGSKPKEHNKVCRFLYINEVLPLFSDPRTPVTGYEPFCFYMKKFDD